MTESKTYQIGTQFIVFYTEHDGEGGYVQKDAFVIEVATGAITGKFCDSMITTDQAYQGLQNVLNYYWLEAQQTEPGCAVTAVDFASVVV